MTEHERRSLYQVIAAQQVWPSVLEDLLLFAMAERDPAVRCGRLDVLAYIEESIVGQPDEEA